MPDRPELDVSYVHLLTLEERYGPDHTFDPEGADRAYTVRELLDGVRRDRIRLEERQKGPLGDYIFVGKRPQITIAKGAVRDANSQDLQSDLEALRSPIAVKVKSVWTDPRRFWRDNWQWVITTVVAVAGIVVAFLALF